MKLSRSHQYAARLRSRSSESSDMGAGSYPLCALTDSDSDWSSGELLSPDHCIWPNKPGDAQSDERGAMSRESVMTSREGTIQLGEGVVEVGERIMTSGEGVTKECQLMPSCGSLMTSIATTPHEKLMSSKSKSVGRRWHKLG